MSNIDERRPFKQWLDAAVTRPEARDARAASLVDCTVFVKWLWGRRFFLFLVFLPCLLNHDG